MRKTVKRLLLFSLFGILIAGALMQTPYVHNKLRIWVEKKSEGTLTIGQLKGVVPFWFRLYDVQYQKESSEAHFDKIDLYLSPTTLLFGHLSFLRLHIHEAIIETKPEHAPTEWPSIPFPISIHSMRIDSLKFNGINQIALSGMGKLSENFSLQINLSYNDSLIHLNLEGDREKQSIGIISQIRFTPEISFWLAGTYDYPTAFFIGEGHGEISSWKMRSDIEFTSSLLSLSQITFQKEDMTGQADATYNFTTQKFLSEGIFLDRSFSTNGHLAWKRGEFTLSDFFLRYAENTLQGHLNYLVKMGTLTGEVDVELDDLSFYPIEHPLEGSGHVHLSLQPEEVTFTLISEQVRWKDLTFAEMKLDGTWREKQLSFQLALQEFIVLDPAYEVFPTAHLKLEGLATKEKLSLKGEVWGLGSTPFTLLADIPITFTSRPLDLTINRTAPFSISLKGKGSIDPILVFLENASLIARGDIDVDLALTGTWDNPLIEGSLIYDNGWVESLTTGGLYRGIHMVLEGEGRSLVIRSMIAHDLERGDLSGIGQIEWNPEEGFPFEFTFYSHRFTLLAIDPLTTTVNAELTISGNIHEMSISGEATIVEGHLAIPNKMPTQVPTLEVTYINPLPTPKPEVEEERAPIPIFWDVKITVPQKLTIEGRGLVSEWRGSLHMSGLQDDLSYTGKLKLVQGRFNVIGRTFDLTEGKIQIEGLEPKDIVVDLKGDLELATITTSIIVRGSLDATQLSFCSTPPMSTNQILSWILFNQDVNELTAFQACRLANVLVSLSGKYAGPKVFDNIKEGLGIDVFDITNCDIDSADFTFQVGKYISQGTFVGVSKSLSGDFDSVLIQTRLFRDFYLEGDYGGSLNGLTPNGGKIIFKWYKTY